MSAALTSVLAAVVVGLMGFGSYGLAASTLNARLREIAIRKALGATSARLILAVGGRTIVLLAAGVMLGLVLSPFADRAVQVQLADFTEWTGPHDVQTAGAWVFGTVAAVVFGVGSASVLLSLRRPLRIPPIEILRRE
jgi:ABC-type antimicrobial peptide transport system permease subunit